MLLLVWPPTTSGCNHWPHTWNTARCKNSTFLFVQHHFIATPIYLANSCQNRLRHHFPHDDFRSLIHKTPCCFPQGLAFQDPLQDEYIIFYYEHLFDTTLYSTRQNFLISQFRLLTGSWARLFQIEWLVNASRTVLCSSLQLYFEYYANIMLRSHSPMKLASIL